MRERRWVVVVPVKRLAAAKTRLRGSVAGVPHERLVLALAQDTVRGALACPLVAEVVVVTDDPAAAAAVGRLGARVVPDLPDAGLNAAIGYGAAVTARPDQGVAATARPDRGVAAVTADLPALRPAELAAALRAVSGRSFVPDAAGTGTTLLAAPPGTDLDPRFGPDSAARHAASGARRLDGDWPSLRRDVDTGADLARAAVLGLGPHTAAVFPVDHELMGGHAGQVRP
jgi:2-phospho-L-lactate/phosphoenolpyruvate guanylyltransferase